MPRLLLLILLGSHLAGYSQLPGKVNNFTKIKLPVTKEDLLKKMELPSLLLPPLGNPLLKTSEYCSCTATGVTSITLEAERLTDEKVKLKWKTLGEVNTKGFDIERSFDAPLSFNKQGFTPPLNGYSSEKEYIVDDSNSYEGASFYRIKEIGMDGKFTYSNIVSVKGFSKDEMTAIFPNPATNNVQVQVVAKKNGSGIINLMDATGKPLMQQAVRFIRGVNNNAFNISSLASGLYIIKITRPGAKVIVLKFVKQNFK